MMSTNRFKSSFLFMHRLVAMLIAIFAVHSLVISSAPAFAASIDKSEVFADLSHEEALSKAAENQKMLVIDFTAEWCGPCKQMDRTTWVDDEVMSWLDKNAITIQVDVDHERAVAKQYNIRAMPTIVVVKNGEEFDRIVGYRDATGLLEWLENVKAGRSEMDRLREVAGDRADESGKVDVEARLDLARALLDRGKFDEATEEFAWLWKNMLEYDEGYYGVRLSFMISDIQDLIEKHEPARKTFTEIRDETEAELREKKKGYDLLVDWVHLNKALDQQDKTIEWFDRVKDRPDIEKAFQWVESELVELLIERERWADVGRIYENPVADLKREIQMMSFIPEDMREEMEEYYTNRIRERASVMYASLLAADRDEDAEEVVSVLLEEQDTPAARIALVEMALKADEVRDIHLNWLEEAGNSGELTAELRNELRELLREAKKKQEENESSGG